MRRRARFLLTLASSLLAAAPVAAMTFTVNDTADAVDAAPGDGTCATAGASCTLRAAIQEANALPGADTIMVPAGTYILTIAGRDEDAAATGDLDITADVTIIGAGPASTILDGNGQNGDRIFEIVNPDSVVAISFLTIRNGNPGPGPDANGGGLFNSGTLTLSNVIIADNTAAANGGGISSTNDVTLTDCVVSGNTAAIFGGGIDNPLTATLTNVTVSGNTSGAGGGGIANDLSDAIATLTNVTIAGNSAPAATGGDFYNLGDATFGYVIVANGSSGENCAGSGTLTSRGHDLDSGNTCGFRGPGDLVDVDPQLGPLQDNGGSSPTQALSPGSPAIDAGGDDCPPPDTDQRGFSRPVDGNGDGIATCDIGAFEFGATTAPTTTTLVPRCVTATTFSSIRCRLGVLTESVQQDVQSARLRAAWQRMLMKVDASLGQSETAFARGNTRRTKAKLATAARVLRQFGKSLRSRAARKVPAETRDALGGPASQLRADVLALRQSPM